jgi:sugar phosphate isomerase/epimerase
MRRSSRPCSAGYSTASRSGSFRSWGLGPFDFGPLIRELAAMHFAGPVEIFMHPVPRGVPILESVAEITAEVNRGRSHLVAALAD